MKLDRLSLVLSILIIAVVLIIPGGKVNKQETKDIYVDLSESAYLSNRVAVGSSVNDLGIAFFSSTSIADKVAKISNQTANKTVASNKTVKAAKSVVSNNKVKAVKTVPSNNKVTSTNKSTVTVSKTSQGVATHGTPVKPVKKVYKNMTMAQLTKQLNKSLNSNLTNKGDLFAKYSVKYGVDPYLATAIALYETGCKWNCSALVRNCNNVGGQKGSPSCGGGSYRSYPTLEAGIEGFIKNIYKNYYQYGLNTAEKMGPKYAGSSEWAVQVNNYINEISSK